MRIEDREDFIDLVAQAVIDKIEERDRMSTIAETVVARVLEMQRQEAALQAKEAVPHSHAEGQENTNVDHETR
jgi:hypothetical protein